MILNNTIILTLEDFKRHFDFSQFWAQRRHFVRDMHPCNIYYCSDTDTTLYHKVCEWISEEDNSEISATQREIGISALCKLSGKKITNNDLNVAFNSLDYNSDIIYVTSGTDRLNLPAFSNIAELKPSSKEKLHKIEITGEHAGDTSILIGGNEVARLKAGDCIYVTERDNNFIRVLHNKGSKGCCHLTLENVPGHFESNLQAILTGFGKEVEKIKGVTQFRFVNGYFEYTNDKYLKYD